MERNCTKFMKKKKVPGKIFNYKLVQVTWIDATSSSEWMSEKKGCKLEAATCHSIGYLLFENSKKLILFADYNEDEDGLDIGNVNVIPKSWVTEVTEIIIK
tara:strand:+ start:380 stop:682 length:303 start_codon:yes stop_codon:yes gene_type:complete